MTSAHVMFVVWLAVAALVLLHWTDWMASTDGLEESVLDTWALVGVVLAILWPLWLPVWSTARVVRWGVQTKRAMAG